MTSVYIHQLKDLTPKSAEMESTFVIRDLKKQTPFPLTDQKVHDYFSLFFVSESEKEFMARALETLEPALDELRHLMDLGDTDFEPVNLQRAVKMLEEIPQPLLANLNYARAVGAWQEEFASGFATLVTSIPRVRTDQERFVVNQKLNEAFNKILRNDVMAFNYRDLVNEAQVSRVSDLSESLRKGFLFRIFLEEELKKLDFDFIKRRIPDAKLRMADSIKSKVADIKKGVDAAYEVNLRMVNWAITIYAYIKWVRDNP